MFTGIIETFGKVTALENHKGNLELWIGCATCAGAGAI